MNEAVIINSAAWLLTAAVPYLAPTAAAVAGKVINGFGTSTADGGEESMCGWLKDKYSLLGRSSQTTG